MWNLDELMYLNISDSNQNFEESISNTTSSITSSTSSGKKYLKNKLNLYDFIKKLSQECFMPLNIWRGYL
jgi:hypothetical protein